jgi:hypothetical protein
VSTKSRTLTRWVSRPTQFEQGSTDANQLYQLVISFPEQTRKTSCSHTTCLLSSVAMCKASLSTSQDRKEG